MFNWLVSLVNTGSISQKNIETQNNYYSAEVDTLLKSIDGYYNDGDISGAFDLISSAISKSNNKGYKYPLLVKKIGYLLETRNIDNAKSILTLLSKDYNNFINIKYKEHLLLIYSLEKKEEDFFKLVEEIKAEKDDVQSDEYFQILYYSNSGNLEDAERLFNKYNSDKQDKNYVVGGHVFSNLYNITKDKKHLEKAIKFYQMILDNKPHFLLKVHVCGFFVENIITKVLQTSNKNFDKKQLVEHKVLLNKLFESKKHFNKQYINQLVNFYAYILLILDFKDEYTQFYDNHNRVLFNEHCLQYWHFKNENIAHKLIHDNIEKNERLLINYASLMTDKDEQEIVLSYFEKNNELLFKYDLLIYFYTKGIIKFEREIMPEIKTYINDNKTTSYELYTSYLLLKHNNSEQINEDESKTLLSYVEDDTASYSKVTETINLLEKIKKTESYIQLAINKIEQFDELTNFVLIKCWHDKELKLEDFELFIDSIDKLTYAPYISDIYFKYDRYDKSFECIQRIWEHEHDIKTAICLLQIGVNNFQRFTARIDEEVENEALFYLQSMQKDLDFSIIGLISYYSLIINKDKNNAFGIINKKVLELNVYELDNENKQQLSSLYFNSIINFKDKELDSFEKNTIFIKDNIYYLDKAVFKNVHEVYIEKFNIAFVSKWEMKKMEEDQNFERKSLFHFLVNQILETIDSPHFKMLKIDLGSSKPFEEMQQMMLEQSEYTENQFERYSNEEDIAFWQLTGSYDKYFNLVVHLIEDETINFNSCRINYQSKKVPKLLTLSSIIFLNYNNILEEVLKKEDIFIQKTTYDWLIFYIEELDSKDEILTTFAKNGEFFKDVVPKERIKAFSSSLKEILSNIKYKQIIDDTKASLPFKDAFSLSKHLGVQEYQALSLSYQQNYQIITEDRMFEVIFSTLNFNPTMIGNSLSLFKDNELHELRIELHKKKYKFVVHLNMLIQLVNVLTKQKVNKFTKNSADIINILNDYGSLEPIKRIYNNVYKVLYPKVILPEEDELSRNIERMLDCIELKD